MNILKKLIGVGTLLTGIIFFTVFILNHNELQQVEPTTIKDGLFTGAKSSMTYISNVRSYPEEEIPQEGFFAAFDDMLMQKRKSSISPIWETMGPINIGGRTLALAIHPEDPDLLFVGSASGGLWKSTTGGEGLNAWEYVSTGFPVLGVGAIDIDPNNPDIMFIGTGEGYGTSENYPGIGPIRTTRGSYGIGILKTDDGGQTWEKTLDWSLDQRTSVQKIQINPLRSESIWAATSLGVFRSRNGGDSWQFIHGIPMATDVIINPADTNKVFVAHGGMGSLNHGIYRTTDAGDSFEKADLVTGGGPSTFNGKAVLAMSSSDPNIVMASIGNSNGQFTGIENDTRTWLMRTEDGGETWDLVFSSTEFYATFQGWYSHAIAIQPDNPNTVWAAGQPFSLYRSFNRGINFIDIDAAPSITVPDGAEEAYPYIVSWADHHDIVYHPTMTDTIYFLNDGGIFKTKDGGNTFINANSGYQTVQFYNGVSNSNTNPNIFLGGLQDNNSIIYDGDLNWRRRWAGDGAWTALNQANNNIAYLSAQYGQATVSYDLYTSTIFGEFYAFPGTEVFPSSETNFITPYILSPADNQTMYIGGEKIFKSNDGGLNWEVTNNGFELDGNAMSVLAASEQSAQVVYAASSPKATRPNVYRTINGGTSWSQITQDLPDRFPTDMTVDPNNDEIAYITFGGFGTSHVFKTMNGGDSWIDIGNGLPDIPTWSVTVDPENSSHLYVGNEIGIYHSSDGGQSWTNINGDLPDAVFAMDLIISRSNRKLRVATHGNGAYELDLALLNSTEETTNTITGFVLQQNYPNPFNPVTNIEFQLETSGEVLLEVFDIQGRLVETIVNEFRSAGSYQVQFNGASLASGTYIYRLKLGDQVVTKRMQLIK